MITDCMAVQSSGRAMSIQTLNIWTMVTIFLSLLYFTGIQVVGALPSEVIYLAAIYHLLTTFFDYSFMANLRDCSGFDFLRWRVDAYMRCSLYIWVFIYLIKNISIQPVLFFRS